MSRIEAIFGGILVLAVVAAISFTALSNGALGGFGGKPGTRVIAGDIQGNLADADQSVFALDNDSALCGCYERGFAVSTNGYGLQSVEYQSGFSACRQSLGRQGGEAWSTGWTKGQEGKLSQRSCKFYLNSLKLSK